MPAYTFEALDADGSTRKGVIEADTAKSARGHAGSVSGAHGGGGYNCR